MIYLFIIYIYSNRLLNIKINIIIIENEKKIILNK